MFRLVRGTWLPTLLFCVLTLAFDSVYHDPTLPVGTFTALAPVLVPIIWWRVAYAPGQIDVGRGAVAGALCGAAIMLLPQTFVAILFARGVAIHGMNQAGIPLVMLTIIFAISLVVAVVIGTGLGVIAARLQRRNLTLGQANRSTTRS
jgi:hypothetical protein